MKEIVFRFFPGYRPFETFAHIPHVFIDGLPILPDLPLIQFPMGAATTARGLMIRIIRR